MERAVRCLSPIQPWVQLYRVAYGLIEINTVIIIIIIIIMIIIEEMEIWRKNPFLCIVSSLGRKVCSQQNKGE